MMPMMIPSTNTIFLLCLIPMEVIDVIFLLILYQIFRLKRR